MATASVILDIRANTQRALNEFKTFSSQLDNKFLVSGLKLDVVRNALSQINREFQKSLGEQGLATAQSMKAAENQATILTNIYAGFSKSASSRIVEDFSTALNQVAVRTGSTVTDVQKSLALSPYLSRSFSQGIRENILVDVQNLQTAARRAGLGGNTGDILNQFLTGQTTGLELQESPDALSKMLGAELTRAGGGQLITSLEERNRVLRQALENIDIEGFAKETGGFRAVLEQFSASLFNPKAGLLGAMREFVIKTGEAPTTLFKETTKLFESIFGPKGFIKTLAMELGKIFGVKDQDGPIRFLGRGIRFITNLITRFTSLIDDILNNPIVAKIVEVVRTAFDGIVSFIRKLDELGKNPPDFPDISKESIESFIREVGENVRGFLKRVGAFIRGQDISDEAQTGSSVIGTIVDEAGKTILTFFREVGDSLLAKTGTIALELVKVLPGTIASLFTKAILGEGGVIGQVIAGLIATRVAGAGLRTVGAIRQARLGEDGLRGALNRRVGRAFGSWDRRDTVAGLEGGARGFQAQMLRLVQRIADCVCGNLPGGRDTDIDVDGDSRDARRERARTRRGPTGPRMPTRPPLTSLDTANPYAYSRGAYLPEPDVRSSYLKAQREARRNAIRRTNSSRYFDLYVESLGGQGGPFADMGEDERALRASRNLETPESLEREDRVRERYNRRFGRRARFGRGIRGFGKGALIAGAIGLGASALFGGSAQASEIDPATGEPRVGAGEAAMRVGGGALEGAMTGATLGSIIPGVGTAAGAAIGALIGGILPLMDKGVRDAVGKFATGLGKSFTDAGKQITKALAGGVKAIQDSWTSVTLSVQRSITVTIPQKITETIKLFTETLPKTLMNFAGSIATSMLDAVKNFNLGKAVLDTWEEIKRSAQNLLSGREVGGPVIRGESYIVGERGPEIFTPGENGSITTNRDLMTLGRKSSTDSASNVVFNITINATGMAGNDIAAAIQPAVMKVLDDSWKQVSSNIITRGSTTI